MTGSKTWGCRCRWRWGGVWGLGFPWDWFPVHYGRTKGAGRKGGTCIFVQPPGEFFEIFLGGDPTGGGGGLLAKKKNCGVPLYAFYSSSSSSFWAIVARF